MILRFFTNVFIMNANYLFLVLFLESAACLQINREDNPVFQLDESHASLGIYYKDENGTLITSGHIRPAIFDYNGEIVGYLDAPRPIDSGLVEFKLPTERLGYFELGVVDAETKLVPKRGSRPPGRLTYCVVNKPTEADVGRGWFSSIQGTSLISPEMEGWDTYQFLGISSVGVGYYSWKEVEPLENSRELDHAIHMAKDPYPKLFAQSKLRPIFYLDAFPNWAVEPNSRSRKDNSFGLPPRNMIEYATYLTKTIPEIVTKYDFADERIYQISWEPNDKWGWFSDDDHLIDMYRVAYGVIKKYDPKARIAGPTIAGAGRADIETIERLLARGLIKYIDIISLHPYPNYPPEESYPSALARIKSNVKRAAGREVPIIATESGYDENSLPGQAALLDHAYADIAQAIILAGEGGAGYTWFYLADNAKDRFGIMYNLTEERRYGPNIVSPKPEFPMVRQVNDMLNGSLKATAIPMKTRGLVGYSFEMNDGSKLTVIWDYTGRNRSVKLFLGDPQAVIQDEFGNNIIYKASDPVAVRLSRAPLYIIQNKKYGEFQIEGMP